MIITSKALFMKSAVSLMWCQWELLIFSTMGPYDSVCCTSSEPLLTRAGVGMESIIAPSLLPFPSPLLVSLPPRGLSPHTSNTCTYRGHERKFCSLSSECSLKEEAPETQNHFAHPSVQLCAWETEAQQSWWVNYQGYSSKELGVWYEGMYILM